MTSSNPLAAKRVIALLVGIVVLLLSSTAASEPTRILTPSHCLTDGGEKLDFPPGTFVTEPDWLTLDKEIRRLQDAETRLQAERDSYRGMANKRHILLSGAVGTAFAAGIVAGILYQR
jgi:hypothetical protein